MVQKNLRYYLPTPPRWPLFEKHGNVQTLCDRLHFGVDMQVKHLLREIENCLQWHIWTTGFLFWYKKTVMPKKKGFTVRNLTDYLPNLPQKKNYLPNFSRNFCERLMIIIKKNFQRSPSLSYVFITNTKDYRTTLLKRRSYKHTVMWEGIRTPHKPSESPMGHVPMVTTDPWCCV
jgi:hypothetical protein